MSKKNINTKKFLTGAITATMVASAVAPVAALAADEATPSKFTDIENYAQSTQDKINALVAAGIITGTSETTFEPAKHITRGQVVKLLGRYLVEAGIAEAPADWETNERFSDLPVTFSDKDLVKNAAIVFEAGVFQGNNGVLNSAGEITRENMALVLDRAAEAITGVTLIEAAEGLENNVTDLGLAKDEAKEAIQALNALEISTVEKFMPKNSVQRVHFATFLSNAIEVIEAIEVGDEVEVVSVSAIDATTLEVTVTGDASNLTAEDFEFNNDLKVLDVEIVEAEVSAATTEKTTKLRLTTSEQEEGVTYSLVALKGEKLETTVEVQPVEVKELVVASVSAINTTVDEAGTLEFAINGEDKAADLEALEEAGYSVEFLASKNVFTGGKNKSTDGVVDAVEGTTFEYQVVITKGDEKYTSERQAVEVQDYAATVTAITKVETTVKSLEVADGKLALGDRAQITVKGTVKGNNKEQTLPATYKVDRPAVLTVDAQGEVTPAAKGTATVTVTVGDKTETVTYTVGDARTVDVSKSTINQSAIEVAAGKTAKVTVELKDQYGLAFNASEVTAKNAEEVTVLAKAGEVAQAKDNDGQDIAGKYEITLTASAKAETGDVVIKADSTEIGKVNVTVKEAGEVASYKLEVVTNTEFDLKTNAGQENKPLTLKAFDKAGLEVKDQPLLGTGFELVSQDKNVATIVSDNQVKLAATAKAGDKVTVVANKLTGAFKDQVAEIEFTVIDSTPVITDVKFTSTPAITAASSIDLDKILSVTAEGSKGEVKVAYTVADNANINIFEANADGAATDVKLGTVQLTKLPTGLGVSFAQVQDTAKATVDVVLVPQTNGGQSPQLAQNKGSFNIAVIDKDNNFKGDTTIDVNITSITAAAEKLASVKAFGYDGEDVVVKKDEADLGNVVQKAVTLDKVANFLNVQYGATLNVENIKAENGTIKITGPLLSAADFKKIKGDKAGAYRLTIEDVAKIAISADGTAVFEALR
ncbi:S-layer homology domain-containing protein [Sporosarcina ureilytica]|uniref:SLH domain-containing protein n=1 Tax=Sporosarcina ureilytica TaxID=298596 RepID=A0A1D8JJ84_9BACL|nr:S-layer homology domain-containing protein [Sporosarcina ureilytica]AOV08769.1 hypothetical protein BI350_15270 [Sporosarcina ureilytica]